MWALILSVIWSVSLYGVWEDKVWLIALPLFVAYTSIAVWSTKTAFGERGKILAPPGALPLLLFLLYSAAMIPFAAVPYEAKISTLRVGVYIGTYWAVANLCSRFDKRRAVWITLCVMLVLVGLYSLVQHKVAPNLIFGMERYTGYWEVGRLGGTYQCPNHIAHLFQMWVPLCLLFVFLPRFSWFGRICFAYAVPVFVALIYQTQSRAGLLGLIAGVGSGLLLLILRQSRKWFFIALLASPLLGAVSIGGLWMGSSMFRERMQPVVDVATEFASGNVEKALSIDFRPQTWADGLVMFSDRPVTGFGPGNYELVFPEYRQRFFANRVLTVHPHNEYIELLGEYGLVGAALVLWVLICVCVPMIKMILHSENRSHWFAAVALLSALAGSAVHGFFDFELRIFPNALMLAVLAGCACAPLLQMHSERKQAHLWLVRLFAVIMILLSLLTVQVMSASLLRSMGDSARLAQDRPRAETLYKLAARIDPQNWRAHLGLGQIYSHYRYYDIDPKTKHEWAVKEEAEFAKAYRHNSKKEEVVYGLGRAELAMGNREKGLNYLRQAADYKRFNDFYWRKLGIELRKAGLYEEALSRFEYAAKLDRGNRAVQRNIQWLKARMGAKR